MSASCRTGGARGDGLAPSLIPPSGQVPLARCVQTSTGTTEEVHRRLLGVECDAGEAAALVACTHAALKPLHVGLWAVDQYRNALARRSRTARGAATSVQRRKRTTPSTVNHNRWICQRNTRTRYTRTFQKCAECMRASRETGARTAIVTSVWCSVSAVSLSEPPRERLHTAPAGATGQRGVRGDTHV